MSAEESRIICRVKGSTERFRIVCFHPSCSFDHLLQNVAATLQVVPPIGTLLLADGAEEEDAPAIESMEQLREGDRCIFVPSNNEKKQSPQIIDVDEIIDIDNDNEPRLVPMVVKSEGIYRRSSEAADSVEQAGGNPSPEIIDVDEIIDIDDGNEPHLAPMAVKSEGISRVSSEAADSVEQAGGNLSPGIVDVVGLPLAPTIVKSESISQGSSEAVDYVDQAGGKPSPEEIIDVDIDIEQSLAPVVVKSYCRSQRSAVEACDKAIKHKVKSEETLPSRAKMEDSSEVEESKEEKASKVESTSGSGGSNQAPPKVGSHFFYRHGGNSYPVIIFKYPLSHGREMKAAEACYIRYMGIKGKAWEGYRLPILVKLSELLVHTEERKRKYNRKMRLQMAARNHNTHEKGIAEEYVNGADKHAVEQDGGKSCTQVGKKSKDKPSIGPCEESVDNKDYQKSRKQAPSNIEQFVATDGSGKEETEKHAPEEQAFEARSGVQKAKRESRRISDRKSCTCTDASQKKKKRVESSAEASEERSSNQELPKLGTPFFYNVNRDLYPVVVCEEPTKKSKQRRPQEGECYVRHTGRLRPFGHKGLVCVKVDKLVAYTKERQEKYSSRMLQSKQGLEPRKYSLVKHTTGVQADGHNTSERAHQEKEKRVAITARQVELAEKNMQLRKERLCEKREAEQEKESRKRQRVQEGKRREEELDMQYGPPTDVSCLSEFHEDDQVEGRILEEPAKNRLVYFAFDNDTAEDIAKKFEINVAKILYDNTKSAKLLSLTKVKRLLAFTPIVIPIRWGGSIYKNPSRVKHKQERTSLVEDVVVVAVTPGCEKRLPPPVLQQANIVSPTQEERQTHVHVRPEVDMMYG